MTIRSPLCVVLAHVDHGKTSILDCIRGTAITAGEAGGITQAIGASIIPLHTIKRTCGQLLDSLNLQFTIPGVLFIDTPGHASFTSLRKRGGNLADIAILVIDINEGIKPQTIESIEILKNYKTPFIIAANKIDLVPGWVSHKEPLIKSIGMQTPQVQQTVDNKIYELVGALSEHGLNSNRFDRVDDFTQNIAIIPTSAKTGEGMPELLMIISGLAQKFLEKCLECNVDGPAKGTILEVKDEKGMGKCVDAIMYDGTIRRNDTLVIGTLDEPIVTKVKGLFEPAPLKEMRDKKGKFQTVKEAPAATGVKISANDLDNAISGMPIRTCDPKEVQTIADEIRAEVEEVLIETDNEGIIIKADTIGSLEALDNILKEKEVPIKRASIGEITKKDLSDAEANIEKDPLTSVILGFNIEEPQDQNDKVKIISNNVIYKIIEDFEEWQSSEKKRLEQKQLDNLVRPCKFEVLKGYIFRQNNPAVVGVDINAGTLKVGTPLMNREGKDFAEVKSLQLEQESIEKAEKNKQVAVSIPGVTVGRQINEGDIVYSGVPEEDFRKLKELKQYLTDDEKTILKEIAQIKRKHNPVWGV